MTGIVLSGGGDGADVSVVTAEAGHVLAPDIFVNASGQQVIGTMQTYAGGDLTPDNSPHYFSDIYIPENGLTVKAVPTQYGVDYFAPEDCSVSGDYNTMTIRVDHPDKEILGMYMCPRVENLSFSNIVNYTIISAFVADGYSGASGLYKNGSNISFGSPALRQTSQTSQGKTFTTNTVDGNRLKFYLDGYVGRIIYKK